MPLRVLVNGIQYTGLCTVDVLDVISRDGDG